MSSDTGGTRDRTLASLKTTEDSRVTVPQTATSTKTWDKLSRWVACVCVVTFDLELGQAIEVGMLAYFSQLY